MKKIKQPGRRYVKENGGEKSMECEARENEKWEAEETRLILQLVPFFVRLLDDG